VRVSLASLESSGRVEIEHRGEPAEVVRSEDGIVARSLLCSHFGCRLEWQSGRDRYHCPCHQGEFDRDGLPVTGPPTRPLRAIPTEVSGRDILVGER
jgi:Rieske Fe-S protein